MKLLHELLKDKKVILASASPRRRDLLQGLDINFTIDTGNRFEESIPEGMDNWLIPEYLAKGKSEGFHRELESDEIIITADTMVLCNNTILGKPKSHSEAKEMIGMLQGNSHTVLTGVCIRDCNGISSFTSATEVFFRKLEEEEIEYYINRYKPFDKAGAYGVQEWIGYIGIERIDGSYFNVMGLPVQRLHSELCAFLHKER